MIGQNYKKRLFSLYAVLSLSSIFAAVEPKNNGKTQPMIPAYNAPAQVQLCGSWDFYANAAFTYWQPIQENMELGAHATDDAVGSVSSTAETIMLDFDYKPGFKVGLGTELGQDNGTLSAQYTWFRGSEKTNKSLPIGNIANTILPAWGIPSNLGREYYFASEKWKLAMDLLDLDLGRSYYSSPTLTFCPFVGMRAGWIRQNLRVDYRDEIQNRANRTVMETTHSWGVGPRLGINANWNLGQGFRFTGYGNGDLLYTHYGKLFFHQLDVLPSGAIQVDYCSTDQTNTVRGHAELGLGLGWGTYLKQHRYYLDFAADYSFQIFMDQNPFRKFLDSNALVTSIFPNGNLYMQGLTARVRLDF